MAIRVNTQILDPILREIVVPDVPIQFQEKKTLYNWLMLGQGEDVNSRGTRIPGYIRPSASNGWRGEGAKLPIAVADEDLAWRVRYTRYRRSFQFTGDALIHMDSATNLVKGLSKRIQRHIQSGQKEINQQMYGTGTGEVAVVDTPLTITSTTVQFARTTANGSTHGCRKGLINGRYEFWDPVGLAQRVGGGTTLSTATSMTRSNGQITFDAIPNNIAAGDILVYELSWNLGLRGLRYHVSAGSEVYQTISRGDFNDTRAVVISANSGNITIALMSLLDHQMQYRLDVDEGDASYISSPAQHFGYELLGHSMKRADVKETKWDGGYKEVAYNGKKWMIDVDCDHDKIYKLWRDALKKFELRPFGIIDDDGKVIRQIPAFATSDGAGSHFELYQGYLGMDADIGSDRPAALGVINTLSITGLPVGDNF